MRCWRRMEKIKWSMQISSEQVLECIGEKGTILNNILCRKANLIGRILRGNCLLRAIERQMKGIGRRRRRRRRRKTQLLDDL